MVFHSCEIPENATSKIFRNNQAVILLRFIMGKRYVKLRLNAYICVIIIQKYKLNPNVIAIESKKRFLVHLKSVRACRVCVTNI